MVVPVSVSPESDSEPMLRIEQVQVGPDQLQTRYYSRRRVCFVVETDDEEKVLATLRRCRGVGKGRVWLLRQFGVVGFGADVEEGAPPSSVMVCCHAHSGYMRPFVLMLVEFCFECFGLDVIRWAIKESGPPSDPEVLGRLCKLGTDFFNQMRGKLFNLTQSYINNFRKHDIGKYVEHAAQVRAESAASVESDGS